MKTNIVVLGSFNVDVTGYAPRLPRNGETVFGDAVTMGPGGKGFNQATAAAKSGAAVRMIARIGNDAFSAFAHQQFQAEGISEELVRADGEFGTGCALIEVDGETGENRIVVSSGANQHVTADSVLAAEDEIAQSALVLTQLETNLDAAEAFMNLAKKHNKPIVLNPAPFREVPRGFFEGVDVFTPNETEAEYFSGISVHTDEDARKSAERMLALGVKRVVITLGKRGVYFRDISDEGFVPSPEVRAVDTTGAGDAFTGALSVRLAEGASLRRAAEYAVCFAALSVTKKGACAAMPERKAAEALEKRFFGRE